MDQFAGNVVDLYFGILKLLSVQRPVPCGGPVSLLAPVYRLGDDQQGAVQSAGLLLPGVVDPFFSFGPLWRLPSHQLES